MLPFAPSAGVLDVSVVRGLRCPHDATPDLLLEIPHGATRTADYVALEARLTSPLPPALVAFFNVNTDAGAPELAEAVARRFVEAEPTRAAAVLRCRVPRTFIDCNRVIDAAPEAFKEGRVTPGLMPWITTPEDRALLRGLYDSYVASVEAAVEAVRARGGAMVMVHTYAPRSVDVDVDADIVTKLRAAYEPDVWPTWPERPMVDVISRTTDGVSHAPAAVVARLAEQLAAVGITPADSHTYPMHPSTMAWRFASSWTGRTLCLEFRRDLLADPFEPFAEMRIGAAKVSALADPVAAALRAWWHPDA